MTTATSSTSLRSPSRIVSIDAFRGITFFIMIIVNELHGISGISKWLKHMPAEVDAMSFPDVVFPAFLFIVGMSIPFGLQARKEKGESTSNIALHIIKRSLALIIMGFFMVNAESGFDESKMPISIALWSLLSYLAFMLLWGVYKFHSAALNLAGRGSGMLLLAALAWIYQSDQSQIGMSPQWWGILGLIGWAYLLACMCYLICRTKLSRLMFALIFFTSYYAIGHLLKDLPALIGVLLSQDAHAAHTTIVLSGLISGIIFFGDTAQATPQRRLLRAMGFCAFLFVLAMLSHTQFPISKIYATPTWCFFSASICVAIYTLLYFFIEVRQRRAWISFFEPVAINPLVCYLIPFIIDACLQLSHQKSPLHSFSGSLGILATIIYACVIVLLVALLNRFNFKMRF